MKQTYTRTLMRKNLAEATIKLNIFKTTKYEAYESGDEGIKVEYTGVTAWDLIQGGAEAEEIESMTDAESIDENHEYLTLHFQDGTESTFRNSHVAMFIW